MKKIFALVLALILGFVCANVPAVVADVSSKTAVTNSIDMPQDVKDVIWESGYAARCRKIYRLKKTDKKRFKIGQAVGKVLLLPLMLFIGTASAEAAARSEKFLVKCARNRKILKKEYASLEEAKTAYIKCGQGDWAGSPRIMYNVSGKVPITLVDQNWDNRTQAIESAEEWRKQAEGLLKEQKIDRVKTETILKIRVSDLKRYVAGRNIEKLMELPGIGEKTAYKVVRALRPICRAEKTMKSYSSRNFTRVVLSHEYGSEKFFELDLIKKGVSPVEAKAIALGGENAIIHVVSKVDEPIDLEDEARIEELLDWWHIVTHKGLKIGETTYVPLGHGTNAAKECKTLWVDEKIYGTIRKWMLKDTQPGWKTTVAKKFAYLCGLQAVTRKSVGIPFMPEDIAIYPSVFSDIKGNMTKEFLDSHEEDLDEHSESVNRSDGYFIIDIPECMIPEYVNRLIVQGTDPEEAEERVMAFCDDHTINSYRANGAALKGCGDKHIYAHKFAWANGITKTPDGRDLHEISVFCDETVIKTVIGENGAYKTFDAWADAVRSELDFGICVKGHGKCKKDVSYQVLQSLCEASGETIRKMAQPTIDRVNGAHTLEGAAKLLGRERGHILKIFPEFANVRSTREMIEHKLMSLINDAFGGKLLHCSYYAFITPDPIYILQGWFGLEKTGCLEAGECHVSGVRYGKVAFWRSPVMHPNSVRVYKNVGIKKEFQQYFKSKQFVIIMNSIDDVSLAAAADWDGDHGSVSDFEPLIEAIEQTLAVWNRLVIWETPKTEKIVVEREDELDYVERLTKTNELGLTVYGLNALLNRLIRREDPATKEKYIEVIPVSKRGVNFKVFAGNVLVDSGKHGGAEIEEPEESSQCKDMLQPWAKQYRDAVKRKQIWKVGFQGTSKCSFFETKAEAKSFVANNPGTYDPVNYLDELASLKGKNRKHMAGTLNKVFALFATYINRTTKIEGIPDKEFDFHNLMFNPEESRRGLVGLMRDGGKKNVEIEPGFWVNSDEGLFNILAKRVDRDRQAWQTDDGNKDKEDMTFEEEWRVNALAEIQTFAEAMGKTLEDAYDVITWQMFKYVDDQYATMDKKVLYKRDNLWRAYWLIFGGMAEEAAMRFEEAEQE